MMMYVFIHRCPLTVKDMCVLIRGVNYVFCLVIFAYVFSWVSFRVLIAVPLLSAPAAVHHAGVDHLDGTKCVYNDLHTCY